MTDAQADPFCDWLSVTYAPDTHPVPALVDVLQTAGFSTADAMDVAQGRKTRWTRAASGSVQVFETKRFVSVSASGRALGNLRDSGAYLHYLAALSGAPCRITRLDAAYDLPTDPAPVIAQLRETYPSTCRLLRKSVATESRLSARFLDGVETGTFYVGNRRTRSVTARVYDKRQEVFARTGEDTGQHICRYEVTATKQVGCTLRDAHSPVELFWHIASPSLLPRPPDVALWHPADPDDIGWSAEMPEFSPYHVLKNRVANSPDLEALIELADRTGPEGRELLLRLIRNRAFPHEVMERKAEVAKHGW